MLWEGWSAKSIRHVFSDRVLAARKEARDYESAGIQQSFVPLPGKAKAEYLSWGLSHYRHPDWLGSSRLESSTTHGIIQSVAYDAFGVPYAQK